MKKTVIAAIIAAVTLSGLASCSVTEIKEPVIPTSTVTETQTETTTLPETTAETTSEPTTVTTTAAPTTTKKPTTTQKVTTTKKETTTKAPETSRADLIEDSEVKTEYLKYGVIRTQTLVKYYEKLEDGSKILVDEEVRNDVFNRMGYYASYADLLPSAKENRETYRDYIEKILEITNGYRAEKGIAPLELDETLVEIANVRAEELAWSAVHSHTRPNMKQFSSIFKEGGISKGSVGENIGWGYATPEEVCRAWKDSPTHYENIMNPNFVKVGFGVAKDPDKDSKLCWVQHFWDGKTE